MTLIGFVFPKIQTVKTCLDMSKESFLRGQFEGQHAKLAQTLLKIGSQHLYHTY